ncbi:MAG: hypothetical protein ACOCYG_06325 [Spirochaetota bacterium]
MMPATLRMVNDRRTGNTVIRRDRRALTLWSILIATNLFGTVVAVRLYREPFSFWLDPFSALGGIRTMAGQENTAALISFVLTMLLAGGTMIGLYFAEERVAEEPVTGKELPPFLRALLLIGGLGYWIAAVPYDVVHFAHSVGSGMAVAALYGWAIFFLMDMAEVLPHAVTVVLHGALHWSVLAYAILFAAGRPEKQGVQKCAFLMILFVLLTSVILERRQQSDKPSAVERRERLRLGGADRGSVAEAKRVEYPEPTED